jgi:hypothetical protein
MDEILQYGVIVLQYRLKHVFQIGSLAIITLGGERLLLSKVNVFHDIASINRLLPVPFLISK